MPERRRTAVNNQRVANSAAAAAAAAAAQSRVGNGVGGRFRQSSDRPTCRGPTDLAGGRSHVPTIKATKFSSWTFFGITISQSVLVRRWNKCVIQLSIVV